MPLYVTEYATISNMPTVVGQVPLEPPVADYTVAIAASANLSPAFQPSTRMVRLHCDVVCSVLLGQNPVATSSNGRFAANQTEYRGVPEGMGFKVSVIQNV